MSQKSPLQRTQFIMMFFAFAFGMMLSSLLSQYGQQKEAASQEKEILFIYRGIEKYIEDLVPQDRERLTELATKKLNIVENAALRLYLLDEAHRKERSLEEIIKIALPLEPLTETEIIDFYEKNKSSLNKPLEDIYPDIRALLENRRMKTAKQILLRRLIKQGDLALLPIY